MNEATFNNICNQMRTAKRSLYKRVEATMANGADYELTENATDIVFLSATSPNFMVSINDGAEIQQSTPLMDFESMPIFKYRLHNFSGAVNTVIFLVFYNPFKLPEAGI